jgi:hypothetical protein
MVLLTQNTASLCKHCITTLAFNKNAIFGRKLAKIAENSDPKKAYSSNYFA